LIHEDRKVSPRSIRVDAQDNVAVVVNAGGLPAGTTLESGITLREFVPAAHKVAIRKLSSGDPIIRYGQVIGYAERDLPEGSWVNEDSLSLPEPPQLDSLPLANAVPQELPPLEGYTFEGFLNADGSVGTKNILAITTTVQCVAPTVDF